MSRRAYTPVLSLLLALGILGSLFSQLPASTRPSGALDVTRLSADVPVGSLDALPDEGVVDVMIELTDEPTARVYGRLLGNGRNANPGRREEARAAARAQKARIDAAQRRVLAHLNAAGLAAKVLYEVQSAYNGIAARIDAKDVARIASHPDVAAVHRLPIHYIENSTSVPFISGVNAWVAAGGNAGDEISIAIIDTGIDYTHAMFGGPGTAAAYSSNNRAIVEPGTFPTAKVVGGRDFAGDAYTGTNTPVPDNDPLDCNGHGTHVAGSAAGYGVTTAGTTYLGPWDDTTSFSSFSIGPGVAPRAKLYALKVFGCSGSTGLTTQAINWAVDPNGDGDPSDHVDVINMSLGSSFGLAIDPSAAASTNAALAGVIVVASAGNAGDTHYIMGSPATSPRAISVANIADAGVALANLRINSPGAIAGNRSALPAAFNPPMSLPASFTADVRLADDGSTDPFPGSPAGTTGTTTDGCQAFASGFFTGQFALIDRGGGCGFTFKVKNAQNAGAVGVIIANNTTGTISMGGDDPTIVIPSLSITQADGNAIKAQLASGVNATLQFFSAGDTASASTSRGPRRAGSGLKPDVSAPGSSITSAGFGTGNGSSTISGTSMAAPHVAGAMAILRQLRPGWSVEELKALIMNTANHDVFDAPHGTGSKYSSARIGAGRVDLADASASEVVAFSDDDPGAVGVSFGTPETTGVSSFIRTVRLVNKGTAPATYELSYVPLFDMTGAEYSFPDGSAVTVPAGGSTTFRVQLTLTAALMKHPRDATMSAVQGANSRQYMSEESGYLTLRPVVGTALRLPVHAAPRPASNMSATPDYLLLTSPSGATTIPLSGQGLNTGSAFPVDELSVVSAFELQEISPANIPSASITSNADLKFVGVTSDLKSAPISSAKIFFAIVTHGQWSTPSDVTFNIFIDRDMNGTDDFQLVNTAFADANGNLFDVFVSARRPAPFTAGLAADSFINNFSGGSLNTVVYNTNMMVIPVSASAIGLTSSNAKFRYRITTSSRGFSGTVDSMTSRVFDAHNPGFDFSGGVAGLPLYTDLNGSSIPVNYNKTNLAANGSLGVLLLHHHNASGAHEQMLPVREPATTSIAVDAATGVYSDPVTLRATVSPATHLDQTISGTVQFQVNGSAVGAPVPVNAVGVATSSYIVGVGAGSHTITATFTSTNPAFVGSSGSGTLNVSPESATSNPSGSTPLAVKVVSPGGTSGIVTLCYDLSEVSDGSPGDTSNISSATVTLTPVGGGSSIAAAAALSGGGVGTSRLACATFSSLAVNVYDVATATSGPFYQGGGASVFTVYDPSLGFVSGGGTLSRDGARAHFGANIKYLKNGNAQGSFLYVERRSSGDVVVKSSQMGTMAVVGAEAVATGKAVVGGAGNHTFVVRFIDNGEPGTSDRLGLRILDSRDNVVGDLTFDPITLSGGNISVPQGEK